MAIRFFFEYEKEVIQLPVNPEEVTIVIPGRNETSEVVKLGEINILRTVGLKECTISSFLPVDSNAPYVLTDGDFKEPDFYINFFNKIRADKKPARFIISDVGINMLVGVEDFEYGLQAQDDDTQYTLDLKEYKQYGSKVMKVNNATKKVSKTKKGKKERQKTGFAIGDIVIASGKYWYIVADKNRKYRYHITTPSGGYRGWVNKSQLKQK